MSCLKALLSVDVMLGDEWPRLLPVDVVSSTEIAVGFSLGSSWLDDGCEDELEELGFWRGRRRDGGVDIRLEVL